MDAPDPFDLQRFVDAQDPVFDQVIKELRQGRKQTHWMWFIFPQVRGLGHSPMSVRYAISSREEAAAYLRHHILGPRLTECTRQVNTLTGHSIHDIFGSPDDSKFHSSMTLFAAAGSATEVFANALNKYFAGESDPSTLNRLL